MPYVAIGIGVVVLWVAYSYNRFVVLRARVHNAWSQIEVQLRMRHDLIPNIVATVQGYAAHEKGLFAQVAEARSRAMGMSTVAGREEAESALSGALRSLFAVAEAYPVLRASENFTNLQQQLQDVEKRLAYTRQFYNDTVLRYNTRLQVFPSNLLAAIFHLTPESYFQAGQESQSPVEVKF
ncbi:MAG: LemA family protein [Limnochordia bacterium]|jgi:LemA protein